MITASELAAMRTIAEDSMPSTCVVRTYSETRDNTNRPVPSYSETTVVCGVDYTAHQRSDQEMREHNYTALRVRPRIRLPHGTSVTKRDQIKVTKLYGSTLSSAITYEVTGDPVNGPTAVVVPVEKVET